MTFTEALSKRGIKWRRAQSGRVHVHLCCPFCVSRGESADTRFRLGVNTRENWANCFNCDWGARVGAVDKILKRLSIEAAVTDGIDERRPKQEKKETELPAGFMLLSDWFKRGDDLPGDPLGYLKRRGISRKQIKRHYIGCTYRGRYAWRVLFPVLFDGYYMGMVARALTDSQEPKYLNTYGEKSLYGLPTKAKELVLSEGVFKALRLNRALHMPSAAMLGHHLKDEQIAQIRKVGVRRVYVWPDADHAGTRGAVSAADALSSVGFKVFLPKSALPYADEVDLNALRTGFSTFVPYTDGLGIKLRFQSIGD